MELAYNIVLYSQAGISIRNVQSIGRLRSQVKNQEADKQLSQQQHSEDHTQHLLASLVYDRFVDAWGPYASQEAAEMAVVIYGGVSCWGREDEDEDDDEKRRAPNLAFHSWAYQVETVPVDYDISDDDPDDPEESSRCSGLHSWRCAQCTEDISSDSANQINDQCLHEAEGVLNSR